MLFKILILMQRRSGKINEVYVIAFLGFYGKQN